VDSWNLSNLEELIVFVILLLYCALGLSVAIYTTNLFMRRILLNPVI